MFDGLKGMMSLLGNRGKFQEEGQKLQAALDAITAEGTAGAGYVTAKATGRLEVQAVRISDEALALNDKEMLEDLVTAAVNQALTKAKEQAAQATAKMAANLGLPPGMLGGGLPGLGG